MIKGIDATGVGYCLYKYEGFKYHAVTSRNRYYLCECFIGFMLERGAHYPLNRRGYKRKYRPYMSFFKRRFYGQC